MSSRRFCGMSSRCCSRSRVNLSRGARAPGEAFEESERHGSSCALPGGLRRSAQIQAGSASGEELADEVEEVLRVDGLIMVEVSGRGRREERGDVVEEVL